MRPYQPGQSVLMSSSSIALPLSGSVPGAQGLTAEWLTPLSRYLNSDETPVAVLPGAEATAS